MNIELENAMLCWDGASNAAKVVRHPDRNALSDAYTFTTGACWADYAKWPKDERLLFLYIEAWQAVVRDGVSAEVMHEALLAIPEFRASLAADVPGSSSEADFAL